MTTPELDQELERLFSLGRAATVPDAAARERIRSSLALRLAASAAAKQPASAQRVRLGLGVAALGVCAAAFWLTRAPHGKDLTPTAAPTAVATPAAPAIESVGSPPLAPPPEAAPAALVAPPLTSPKPAPLAASNAAPSSTHGTDPAEELPLVRAMQQASRSGNTSQALALAADHARRFPRGVFVEERESVRAVAQCQLAAPGARGAVLAAFAQRFATSPYAARVKAACQ
jgi:type IV secretory pathway VirB10-like protein